MGFQFPFGEDSIFLELGTGPRFDLWVSNLTMGRTDLLTPLGWMCQVKGVLVGC